MEFDEKLDFVEMVLRVPNGSLSEETFLEDIDEWNDEGIANFQVELIAKDINIGIDELKECERVAELCRFLK